tara:strand:+ start:155 stop:589 length:435 start_codon:yes stop_codon:yes gene_type:complete
MTCKAENIIARIVSNLAGTTSVGARIYRSRLVPITKEEFPSLVVEVVSNSCSQATSINVLDWTMQIRIVVLVRGTTTTSPDEAADPILESLFPKIMGDLTLNGHAIDIQPTGTDFIMADADQPTGAISTNWTIMYRTTNNDLTQ